LEENGNQPFLCSGKWILEENGISFLEENGTAPSIVIYEFRRKETTAKNSTVSYPNRDGINTFEKM